MDRKQVFVAVSLIVVVSATTSWATLRFVEGDAAKTGLKTRRVEVVDEEGRTRILLAARDERALLRILGDGSGQIELSAGAITCIELGDREAWVRVESTGGEGEGMAAGSVQVHSKGWQAQMHAQGGIEGSGGASINMQNRELGAPQLTLDPSLDGGVSYMPK